MSIIIFPVETKSFLLNNLNNLISCWDKTILLKKYLKFTKLADNKDKLLKILQYIIKLIVFSSKLRLRLSAGSTGSALTDLKSFASTLSLARRLGRLGNWSSSLQDLCELPTTIYSPNFILKFTSIGSSFGNDLLDDWICLQKGKLLQKVSYIDVLDSWSTNLWFISTSIDLYFNMKKLLLLYKERERGVKSKSACDDIDKDKYTTDLKIFELKLAISKQICDWTFCWWEIADWTRRLGPNSELIPIISGFMSAVIGAIKGWRKLE